MKCPACTVELKIYVRQGIEVDYCPRCRGVWLDRGEIDRIIEAAQNDYQAPPMPTPQTPVPPQRTGGRFGHAQNLPADYRSAQRRDFDDDENRHSGKTRKKRGLLGELFDIFD